MRIALAQVTSSSDPQDNLELLDEWTGRAAERGAELVIFPEAMMCSFGNPLPDIAEPVDGPWASRVREIAIEHGVTAVAGMFTPADDGRVRNTLLVTGSSGTETYDKIHLFDAFGFHESDGVAAGERPVVVDIGGVRVGLTTCYDIRFPGLFTELARRDAQVIVVAASWGAGPGKVAQWELLAKARALDATVFVAACGQAEPTGPVTGSAPTGVGHSTVVSPLGVSVETLGAGPGLLVVDLDLDELGQARASLPVLANARF